MEENKRGKVKKRSTISTPILLSLSLQPLKFLPPQSSILGKEGSTQQLKKFREYANHTTFLLDTTEDKSWAKSHIHYGKLTGFQVNRNLNLSQPVKSIITCTPPHLMLPSCEPLGVQRSADQPQCPDLGRETAFEEENKIITKLCMYSQQTFIEP